MDIAHPTSAMVGVAIVFGVIAVMAIIVIVMTAVSAMLPPDWGNEDDESHPSYAPVQAELGTLPDCRKRTCCGTLGYEPHQPGCVWAPPPPSPARWSNRR